MVQDTIKKHDQLDKNMQAIATGLSVVVLKVDNKVEQLASDLEIKTKETDLKFLEVEGRMQRMDNEIIVIPRFSRLHVSRLQCFAGFSKIQNRKKNASVGGKRPLVLALNDVHQLKFPVRILLRGFSAFAEGCGPH